ncbi:MAG: aldo/keto reductase [Novosphingobium sp.]|jgi:aryl-alcohol dehydrogenase-like predicted oxidoreductase|nr:aldo/keto reductase [Novosphingobium sp.]
MEYRPLGRSGLMVSVFSFGAMTFGDGSGTYATVGDTRGADAERQIGLCLDAGVNLFDTADVYTGGQSEELLGAILRPRRQEVLIASKCLGRMGPGVNDLGAGRKHIVEACEASLKRLGTDYIDLYQIHNQDLLVPVDETLRALDDLVKAGKVRYIGSSNHAGWTKMRALATADRLGLTRYVSQQIRYSLLDRASENELLPLGVHEGVGAMIWGPLASGYLSGKFRKGGDLSDTRIGAGAQGAFSQDSEHSRRVLSAVEDIAVTRGVTLSQVALNWLARRPGVATIIIGARRTEQLEDNLGAAAWSLNDAEMEHLDKASATPPTYPYDMHRFFTGERNPGLPLQPALPAG